MRERRYPLGLKAMVAVAALGLLVAVLAGIGLVGSVLGLFGSSAQIQDGLRPGLVVESHLPSTVVVDLPRGSYAVYVIAENDELPGRSRSVRLDLRVTAVDGTVIRYEAFDQPATYRDPRTGADLGWVGDVDIPRSGRYRIEAREVPGATPVDRFGLGETPGFGAAGLPWIGGIFLAFVVGIGGLMAAVGFGIGAIAWGMTLARRDRLPPV